MSTPHARISRADEDRAHAIFKKIMADYHADRSVSDSVRYIETALAQARAEEREVIRVALCGLIDTFEQEVDTRKCRVSSLRALNEARRIVARGV